MQSIAQINILFNFTCKQLHFIMENTSTPLSVTMRISIVLFILCQSERNRRLLNLNYQSIAARPEWSSFSVIAMVEKLCRWLSFFRNGRKKRERRAEIAAQIIINDELLMINDFQ